MRRLWEVICIALAVALVLVCCRDERAPCEDSVSPLTKGTVFDCTQEGP